MKWLQETISLTQKTKTRLCPNCVLQITPLWLEKCGTQIIIIYKSRGKTNSASYLKNFTPNWTQSRSQYTEGEIYSSSKKDRWEFLSGFAKCACSEDDVTAVLSHTQLLKRLGITREEKVLSQKVALHSTLPPSSRWINEQIHLM